MHITIDVPGKCWSRDIIEILLSDRTTNSNIFWATNDYDYLGEGYSAEQQMSFELLKNNGKVVVHPGFLKARESLNSRQKLKAEVFTPSWLCNYQNNLGEQGWFENDSGFNYAQEKEWVTNNDKIQFRNTPTQDWQAYIHELCLEVTCGEAPYLVSRYDTVTGQMITVHERIGLLDRKLRIISEQITNEHEWLQWVEIAFQSIYGFELQGDNLLVARANLLATFIEYMLVYWQREPTQSELIKIANIISWNLWQMDGLSGCVPFAINDTPTNIIDFLFADQESSFEPLHCKIMNWNDQKVVSFIELIH